MLTRRPPLIAIALSVGAALYILSLAFDIKVHSIPYILPSGTIRPGKSTSTASGLEATDAGVRKRIARMRKVCAVENQFEREYGRTNLRLSRGYEGVFT